MELRQIIGKNIADLRKKNKLTQLELANQLNYSDKAVSKWEHGDALPSVEDLIPICQFFNVTLDQLTSENLIASQNNQSKTGKTNKIVISLLSVLLVWFIATIVFVGVAILTNQYYWQSFVIAVPLSCIVILVFNSIWGKRSYNYAIISVLIWSLLAAVYCSIGEYRLWMIFLIGIPGQVIVVIWSRWNTSSLRMKKKDKKEDKELN